MNTKKIACLFFCKFIDVRKKGKKIALKIKVMYHNPLKRVL
jgi:hypothetical protein